MILVGSVISDLRIHLISSYPDSSVQVVDLHQLHHAEAGPGFFTTGSRIRVKSEHAVRYSESLRVLSTPQRSAVGGPYEMDQFAEKITIPALLI